MTKSRREHIIDTFGDVITKFVYYDRKEDAYLPVGSIEKALQDGEVTITELCQMLWQSLHKGCNIPLPKPPVTTNTITCAYCGYAYNAATPATQHERLSEHIKVCTKHPLREAEAQTKNLVRLLRQVYHHPANVTGERFSEHLMDADYLLAKEVAVAIGDVKAGETYDPPITEADIMKAAAEIDKERKPKDYKL